MVCRNSVRFAGVVALLAALAASAVVQAAEVGDKAPALTIGEWLKGGPVKLADGKGKSIYVVEFWATWCGPCKTSIPHLSALQKQFKDKGVVIIGVTDEDPKVAKDWMTEVGKPGPNQIKMEYTVAADSGRKTSNAFRSASQRGIPHAYVVDKTGTIVWNGHPMDGLDRVLTKVVAGTYDPKVDVKKGQLKDQAIQAFNRGKKDEGFSLLDQLIAADPQDRASYDLKLRAAGFFMKPEDVKAIRIKMAEVFKDNADVLGGLASDFASAEDLAGRDPVRAVTLARRAVELTGGKDANVLGSLARAHYALCDIDNA